MPERDRGFEPNRQPSRRVALQGGDDALLDAGPFEGEGGQAADREGQADERQDEHHQARPDADEARSGEAGPHGR